MAIPPRLALLCALLPHALAFSDARRATRPSRSMRRAAPPLALSFERVPLHHAADAFRLEISSYPPDEAASLQKLTLRLTDAPQYFWGAYDASGALRGFVCGTLTADSSLTEESMSTHEPSGTTLCIHSVVTEASCRRQGVGSWMMQEYLARVAAEGHVRRVLLLCKEGLVGFYEDAGFSNRGDSGVEHGQDNWILMERVLGDARG
ncbi:hypothetical protein AB1Y20_003637 [Prymnesium parvum]|uniref:N-acetyltransferase domain-containing protein n=1 Tax=Prymnesium parvum TaxID=97485 RepID=A0AB34J6T2_PRYPA|mmetsp:Transcript_34986/g.85035  ORF Transcript_34986/g.85035 Transcript_34986/m.85035 type:complete len:206 (+) Transcript_34986:2-619(+)